MVLCSLLPTVPGLVLDSVLSRLQSGVVSYCTTTFSGGSPLVQLAYLLEAYIMLLRVQEVVTSCRDNTWVTTLAGRRRHLAHIHETGKGGSGARAQAERQAVNTVCQVQSTTTTHCVVLCLLALNQGLHRMISRCCAGGLEIATIAWPGEFLSGRCIKAAGVHPCRVARVPCGLIS